MHEREIIQLICDRDGRGMEELLKHYSPLIRYIITPILPNIQDQEDCLNEVAMRIWDKIGQYDPLRGSWNAWLTALARNTALNKARQNKRFDTAGEVPPEIPATGPTPEEQVLQKEREAVLEWALRQLSEKERMLFYRKYYYLQPIAQIASELGMTERAIEGRLYRLRQRLRKLLGGKWYG